MFPGDTTIFRELQQPSRLTKVPKQRDKGKAQGAFVGTTIFPELQQPCHKYPVRREEGEIETASFFLFSGGTTAFTELQQPSPAHKCRIKRKREVRKIQHLLTGAPSSWGWQRYSRPRKNETKNL
jgi:hypothetical protein